MSKATEHVRVVATDLLNRLWRQRREVWDPTPRSVDDIFPLDVRAIAEKGLGVRFEEPEEIPPGEPVVGGLMLRDGTEDLWRANQCRRRPTSGRRDSVTD